MIKISLEKPVNEALKLLSEQQRDVLVARFSLNKSGKRQTLQNIADKRNVTRERIRQIQEGAIQRLREDRCVTLLANSITKLESALHECSGVADEEAICNLCKISTPQERGYVRLLLEVGEAFSYQRPTEDLNAFWYMDANEKRGVEKMLRGAQDQVSARPDDVFSYDEIVQFLKSSDRGSKVRFHDSVVTLMPKVTTNEFGEWGHVKNKEITLRSMGGYIGKVLRAAGQPLHYSDVAQKVTTLRKKRCSTSSCLNELVRSPKFILVGRGTYAIAGDTYKPGTIRDVIAEYLGEVRSATLEEIVDHVLTQRVVAEKSVVQTLQREKKMFTREGDTYRLR